MHKCNRKCPKCRIPCVSRTRLGINDSCICLINAPLELMECYNDDDLKAQIWAGMQPPKISDPTPAVNPERLERVRELLDATAEQAIKDDEDDAIATRVESTISIEIGEDGAIKRTKSRREIKWYPACQDPDDTPYCMPDCTPASERDIKELFRRSNCTNVPKLAGRRTF